MSEQSGCKSSPLLKPKQAQQKALEAQTLHRPHQPEQVVAHSTTQGVQRITRCILQPSTLYAVVRFQVPDGWLYRLSALEPASLRLGHSLDPASMDDLQFRIGQVHLFALKAQVYLHLLGCDLEVLKQDGALLHLRGQDGFCRVAG